MIKPSNILSNQWIWLCAPLIALGWLLPNHFPPWSTFHHDAWFGIACVLTVAPVILRCDGDWQLPFAGCVLLLMGIPIAQWVFGLIQLTSMVWLSCVYIFGFALVICCAARWETAAAGQLLDGLFFAIGTAAILSVWLQLRQWLQLDDGGEWWSMGTGGSLYPFANFGQRNQAATFLLWGACAIAWAYVRRQLRPSVGIFAIAYLFFGVALTGSRSALLGAFWAVVAIWGWRTIWSKKYILWIALGLLLYLGLCVVLVTWINAILFDGASHGVLDSNSIGQRYQVWTMLLHAAIDKPWYGYGWGQTTYAYLYMSERYPSLNVVFSAAHNIFIDFIIWCGLPTGVLISVVLIHWLYRRLRGVENSEQAVLLVFVLMVFNHAMLELPLYYAYVLLPLGLVVGSIESRMGGNESSWCRANRKIILAWYGCAAISLFAIILDYLRFEPAYRNLRYEQLNIRLAPWEIPDMAVLTELSTYVKYLHLPINKGLDEQNLMYFESITRELADGPIMLKMALTYAANSRAEKANWWLARFCKVQTKNSCAVAKNIWRREGMGSPEIAAVAWPQ